MYTTGLVVGKFCPFHKGHELLLNTAIKMCEKVIVISYTSEAYRNCAPTQRANWLKYFNPLMDIHVLDGSYILIPKDTDYDFYHREFIADYLLNDVETTVQAVFTSEEYGEPFAKHLSTHFSSKLKKYIKVEHVCVDLSRSNVNISGTELRNTEDIGVRLKYLNPYVLADTRKKVLFLGGESSGKSTICSALSTKYGTAEVPEYGRELYDERNKVLLYEDMVRIAKKQILREYRASFVRPGLLAPIFCDTSAITTLFYSHEIFGRVPIVLKELVEEYKNRYDHVFLCDIDFEMVQDGTRQNQEFREKGHFFFKNYLQENNIPFTLLRGSHENRIKSVESVLRLKVDV